MDDPGFDSWQGQEIFCSKSMLGMAQAHPASCSVGTGGSLCISKMSRV